MESMNVIYQTTEGGLAGTIKPRLAALRPKGYPLGLEQMADAIIALGEDTGP